MTDADSKSPKGASPLLVYALLALRILWVRVYQRESHRQANRTLPRPQRAHWSSRRIRDHLRPIRPPGWAVTPFLINPPSARTARRHRLHTTYHLSNSLPYLLGLYHRLNIDMRQVCASGDAVDQSQRGAGGQRSHVHHQGPLEGIL